MNSMKNKVQLIGNLGTDPEVVNLDSGKKLVKCTLATNDYYTNAKGERLQNTQWHNLVAWNKTADILEKYVVKGQEVAVEGKLTTRTYEDKEGVKRYITEILVHELVMFGKG